MLRGAAQCGCSPVAAWLKAVPFPSALNGKGKQRKTKETRQLCREFPAAKELEHSEILSTGGILPHKSHLVLCQHEHKGSQMLLSKPAGITGRDRDGWIRVWVHPFACPSGDPGKECLFLPLAAAAS